MMLQFGQTALTMSRSSDSSCAQPPLFLGNPLVLPFWLTCMKHGVFVLVDGLEPLHAGIVGMPNVERYVFMSLSAFGSL
jgi:hypothetical protein